MRLKNIILTAALSLLHLCTILYSQPTAFTHAVHSLEFVEPVVPEPIDLQAVLLEDRERQHEVGPYRFAIQRTVNITPEADGLWEEIDDETLMWRLPIASPDAVSLNLGFTRYRMPPGGQLYLYSADENQVIGPFTEKDNKEHGQLWTPLIYSDAIIVELTIPALELPELEFELTSINHGYRGFNSRSPYNVGDSDYCQVNAICPEGNDWRDQIRSVAFYYINGGASACTGSLVNNTAQDGKPYLLTAFHCFDGIRNGILSNTEREAIEATMVVYWNYEAYSCGDRKPTVYSEGQSQLGASFRAGYWKSDFAPVELEKMPPPSAGVYYAGWDLSENAPLSGATIHHPQGDLKKISIENDPLSKERIADKNLGILDIYFKVNEWDVGITEKASSGSPFFNSTKRIVGQLYGSLVENEGDENTCDDPKPSVFGPLYRSWTEGGTREARLSDRLDPLNSAVMFLNGRNADKTTTIGSGDGDCPYPMFGASDIRTEVIYLANEIGSRGTIKSLALYVTTVPGFQSFTIPPVSGYLNDWTIKMKNTSSGEYNDNHFDNDAWIVVYQNDENIDGTGWRTFQLQTPFEYNGIDNLKVQFTHRNGLGRNEWVERYGACRVTNTGRDRAVVARSDTQSLTLISGLTPPDYRTSSVPDVQLIIEEENRDKTITIGSGDRDWIHPIYGASDQRTQVIYLASEIGSNGIIKSLALDVTEIPGYQSFSGPPVSGYLNDWTITMKHTRISEYEDNHFDNDDWIVVYKNNENIDGTGWQIFEFQRPFEYNGTDNLMVDFSHSDGNRGEFVTRSGACRATNTYSNRSIIYRSDTQKPLSPDRESGTRAFNVPNVKLTIRNEE